MQVPAVAVQPVGIVSVIVVAVAAAVKVFTTPLTEVPAVDVVITSLPKPFVPLKVKVPTLPMVLLAICKVAERVFVNVQVKLAEILMLAAGIVSVLPDSVPNGPVLPVRALFASVQLAVVSVYPARAASVRRRAG